MIVTLENAKEYLRVDYDDDDALITTLITTAQNLCMDISRITDELQFLELGAHARIAILYAIAYLYEHREAANHNELVLTLRALLFGIRQEGF